MINLSHPYIGRDVMDGYGRKGKVVAYIGGDFRIEFEHCFNYKTEKEVRRMINLMERFEAEQAKKEGDKNVK